MLKQIKQINETLKIGDKFTIYYAPTFTKNGEEQTTIYEPHQYEVNVRSAIWDEKCKDIVRSEKTRKINDTGREY